MLRVMVTEESCVTIHNKLLGINWDWAISKIILSACTGAYATTNMIYQLEYKNQTFETIL